MGMRNSDKELKELKVRRLPERSGRQKRAQGEQILYFIPAATVNC